MCGALAWKVKLELEEDQSMGGIIGGSGAQIVCGSDPSELLGCCWSRGERETKLMALKDSYTSVTGDHPRPRLNHSPDLVRLIPPHFPSTAPALPISQLLSLSPSWEQTSWSLSLNSSALSPPYRSTGESRDPEASKGGGA